MFQITDVVNADHQRHLRKQRPGVLDVQQIRAGPRASASGRSKPSLRKGFSETQRVATPPGSREAASGLET